MIPRHGDLETYADILGTDNSLAMKRLVTTLDVMCAPITPPQDVRLDAAINRAVQAAAVRPIPLRRRRSRSRVVGLVTLLVVAVSAGGAYLVAQSPAPVTAQAVLGHAVAASRLGSDQVAHLTYTFYPRLPGRTGGMAGPMDVWLQTDAQGATSRFSFTMTIYRSGAVAAVMRGIFKEGRGQTYTYDPNTDEVAISPATSRLRPSVDGLFFFDPSSVAAYLLKAAQGGPGRARLLPRQTLDGVTTDVVQIPGDPRHNQLPMTAYFDAQNYLLRGLDETESPAITLRIRVGAYNVVAANVVPVHTFDLNAPSTARVVPNVPVPEFVPGD
jgi:hypothetical protein